MGKRKAKSPPKKGTPSAKKTKTAELTVSVDTDETKKLLRNCPMWDGEKYKQLTDSGSKKHYAYYRTLYTGLGNLKTGAAAVASKFVDPSSSEVESIHYILSIATFATAATVVGLPVAITLETAKIIIKKISDRHKSGQAASIIYILDDVDKEKAFDDDERHKTAYNCVVRYWEAIDRLTVASAELVAELAVERIKQYLIKHGLIAEALKNESIPLSSQFPVAINIMKMVGGRKRKLIPEFKIDREMYSHGFYDLGGIKVNTGSNFDLYLSENDKIKSSASKYLFRIGTRDEAILFNMKKQENIPHWYQFTQIPKMKTEIDTLTELCGQLLNSVHLLELQQWQKSLTVVNTGTMVLSDKAFQEWLDFLFARRLQESFDKSSDKSSTSTLTDKVDDEDMAEKLAREAKKGGFICQNVAGFGNCFFNAFAHQLYVLEGRDETCQRDEKGVVEMRATDKRAGELRAMATKEIKDHWDEYKYSFLEDKTEVEKMGRSGTWVDETYITALVNAFARKGRYLTVVLTTHRSQIMQVFRAPGSIEVMNLGCEIGHHYQSLMIEDKKTVVGQPTKQQKIEEDNDPMATKIVKQTMKLVAQLRAYQELHLQVNQEKQLEEKINSLEKKIKSQLEIVYPNERGVNADIERNIKSLERIRSKNAAQQLELDCLKSISQARQKMQPDQSSNRENKSIVSQVNGQSFMPMPSTKSISASSPQIQLPPVQPNLSST